MHEMEETTEEEETTTGTEPVIVAPMQISPEVDPNPPPSPVPPPQPPNIPISDQLVDRCVFSATWIYNIIGDDGGSKKQRRGLLTCYDNLDTEVTHDANNVVPAESIVFSKPSAEVSNLTDADFVASSEYTNCSLVPRVFTPSIRSAGEIINFLACSQYKTYHIYSARRMTPAFLSNCASNPAFGNKREKRAALRKCFANSSKVDALIKDFEKLRDNAYAGFIRALKEKSPVNMALAAWVCGRATANHILLRKNKMKYSGIEKYETAGLFNNDGTILTDPDDYITEIGKRSKNKGLTFDTATSVFDSAIKRNLKTFIDEATDNSKTEKELSIYLRQTRFGTTVDNITNSFPCLGMLTPRNQEVIRSEIESMSNNTQYTKAAHMLDEELNFVSKKRKRHATEDFDETLASNIVAASAGSGTQTEWSMHITQLVSQAFLEAVASLLASAFGVADPFSEQGIKTIKDTLVKNEGNETTKRIEVSAPIAAIEYFVKIGNFTIPFVASDPNDILEGRRVSPNTPIIFLVNKKTDPTTNEISTVFSIRDRLLVEDKFMESALKSTATTAATYKDLSAPTLGGSLPVIRGPLTTGGSSLKEAKESISLDWYIHLSNMCGTGKTSAAVASGISRALTSINAKKKSVRSDGPSEKELKKALRNNVDRSKNLLVSLGQNLSSWGYEEHNATVSSFWSSTAAVRASALQEALNRSNDVGVRHQMDVGCTRDSFVGAEAQLRMAFFKAVNRPGDSVDDILASFDGAGGGWQMFLEAMEKFPRAFKKVFNLEELINAIESFKFPISKNQNISSSVKLLNGLVNMTLQSALNTSKLAEAGSVADGWSRPAQFEPSRMRALEDLAGSRHRNDVVSVLLNRERGSISFGNSRRKTNVLVIPLVILEYLVADKVVLDSYCSAADTRLYKQLDHFMDTLSGNNKTFKDQNRFLTLVRYIWFNVAILSLTDSNIISAIDMTQRDLGASIYKDYVAIMSLINAYGRDMSKFSIGRLIEVYTDAKNKTTDDFCTNTNKISTDAELNSVLRRLTTATSAFSGENEAKANGVQALTDEDEVRNIDVNLNINELIGVEGKAKIDKLMTFLLSIVNSSINLKKIMKYASNDNAIPNPVPIVMSKLNVTGPALSKVLLESKVVEIDHNAELKDSVIKGYTRLMARLNNEPVENAQVIDDIRNDMASINRDGSPLLVSTYNIPAGITAKNAIGMISALNERYPHLDILLISLQEFVSLFATSTPNTVTIKLNDLKRLLKHGNIIALTCLSTTHGTDFNSGGVNVLAKVLAHFSAEATLALSRIQRTFSPIHPGLLTLYDTFEPSKDSFDYLTEHFINAMVEKIEKSASPILSRCDDAGVARGLAEAGKNYNNTTTSILGEHIRNPTDVWNKYSLAHFDTAVVPKYARLSNTDILKLTAFWQGMTTLPDSTRPSKWDSNLVGNNQYGSNTIPGMSNVCTFNSALDTMLANPENSCGLITREITRNSARLAHDLFSGDTIKTIEDSLGKGVVSVIKKTLPEKKEERVNIFTTSTTNTISSTIGLIAEQQQRYGDTGSDLVFNAIRSIPKFRQNIIEATRSLFESAAICSLLSSEPAARVASKKIINLIKDTSPVIDDIGINRIAGLMSSITSPKQFRTFLAFVDEKRKYWMRKAAIQYNACGDDNDDSVYLGLASVSTSKTRHMSDKFWMTLLEDCDNYVDDEHGSSRQFTSKLNSYAAVATDTDRGVSLKNEMKTRQAQVKNKLADIEAFIVGAAKTDLHDDSNVALSNLLKAQRLFARMTAAAEIRNNDSALSSVPCGVNVISGVFDEMTTDTYSASNLLLVSKLMVAKELVKYSSTPESLQFILASAGIDVYKLAEVICQRMTRDDISLFLGGTMLQRGLFTTFLLNDILVKQISPELKTESISDDTKTKLINLIEFCAKIKRSLLTMRNNKGRAIRRYNRCKKKLVTDDIRADWAFASSVYSAYNTLRDRNSLGETSSRAAICPKRNSNLHDVLTAGSTLNRSFFTNYCEKAAASKIVRISNIRKNLRARKTERPSLLACFDSGKLLSEDVEGVNHAAICGDEDYDMIIDEEDMMDTSSDSSSDESSTDYLYSSEEEEEDEEENARRDALDTLDTMAVPLGRLYECGDDYDDEEENNVFNRNLGRMIGRVGGGASSTDDDDDDEDDPYSKSIRHAKKIVYGAGFLSGGFYSKSLGKFLRGKRARFDDEEDYDDLVSTTSSSDDENIVRGDGRHKRRSRQDQLAFLKRGLHQFVPKDILIDDKDRITIVEYISDKKVTEFYKAYTSANRKDRKELRDKHKVTDVTHLRESRIERIDFRRSLVKSTAVIIKTLKNNTDLIYSALFATKGNIPKSKLNAKNVEYELLFSNKLKEIVDKRNAFIKDASASAPTLFSGEDKVYDRIDNGGYLHTPLVRMAACIKNNKTGTQLTVPELLSICDKSHLDWLNIVAVIFTRDFNVSTGYALDETFKVTTVLKSLYGSFFKLISSTGESKVDVKSTLFSDIFNTRMVHTGAILGLYCPTAFMNHQLAGKTKAETNEIETELLTLVRGVNSRQLYTSDLGGSTDVLLNRLMSKRVAGPSGMRGGLSLFRMSLTDTVLGKGDYRDGRVKGAVSLEVPVEGGAIIENHVFSKKCKDLVNFCKEHNILLANASGPVYRFATGVKNIASALELNELPPEDVAYDPIADRLVCSETTANRGAFMRLSAYGNLFGCTDIITRLARKLIETYEMLDLSNPTKDTLKKILDNIKARRVKSIKSGKKNIVEYPKIPSLSDNVLLKSREFMFSVTTLINNISQRLSLQFNKFSLKSFERILENSAILANTKTTLRNLENRLQAAVAELKQFQQIREEGLTVPRNVIANVSDKLCTLRPDKDTKWLKADYFIKFVVDSELFNLEKAKMNITKALGGVHVQHIALLEMINSAIHSGTEESSSVSERRMMNVSPCGKYVIHPVTKMLVKIEDGDADATGGIESVHRQVALKVLERIDRNKNSMLRSRLYAMRKGRGDLRDIVSFSNEDIKSTDNLIKYLSSTLAETATASPANPPSNSQQKQKSGERQYDSLLPSKKSISYIPVASENKQHSSPLRECTSVAAERGSVVSDSNDKTYRFLDQQEAHDLSSIINILSKHKFGEYNQASIVSLFNKSQKYSIQPPTESPSVPHKTTTSPKKRLTEHVAKVASQLSNTAEYNELTDVYDDMKKALDSSASLKTHSFFVDSPKMGEQPKVDYDTIKVVSEMKQLKSSAMQRYVNILNTLEHHENDSSKTNTSSTTIESTDTSIFDKLESASCENSIRDVMNKEAAIRITLLMHYEPFLDKIQRILDMITQYFKNIDELNSTIIPNEVKKVSENQTQKFEKYSEEYRQNLIPHFNRSVAIHTEEIKAIKTEIETLSIKNNEVDNIYKLYSQQLESLSNKLNTGTNESSISELMKITDDSQQNTRTINDLKEFAGEHEGVVYQVPEPSSEFAKSDAYTKVSKNIGAGQETVKVSFKDAMALFPESIQEINSNDDIKLFTMNLRTTLNAFDSYKAVLAERIRLLWERAHESKVEAKAIETKIKDGESVLEDHVSDQKRSLQNNMSVAINTVESSLSSEVIQHELLTFIEVRVERLIANLTRGDSPQTADEKAGKTINEKLVAEVAGESIFACQLQPLHDSMDRMMDMYHKKKTGSLISTGVDLQLSSIFDMSMAVVGEKPQQTASAIVPGLCQLCAMMVTNLHEAIHISEHSFNFDTVRSTETLKRMLSAIISRDSDKANVRYEILSLLESHNGYIKDLKFTKKQTVACMTPVNTLPGAYGNMVMHPGTVLLPSSELFACDGLDHDKFRAMAHRCNDPALADSSKSADSIVETLATSSPNAEMLFYTHKDERRHFNSIPDCIIEHMGENANSVFNTKCSQSTVKEDSATGIPIFVGRGGVVPDKTRDSNGGIPTHCGGTIDMSAKYMVAPGSTLNAKKEEMMRLSWLSDVNNVKYGDLDVNVAGSNSAWRIGEIVKAACGGNDMLMEKARKMLLLGSVTSIAQQKASTRMNDPSTLLQTNSVVDQCISDIPMSSEDLVAKMSYQQRFFPEICSPGNLLADFKRYRKAMGMAQNNGCRVFLDNLASVPTSSTPQGILDTVVQSQSPKEISLAVEAMTDSTVDMVAAVSSGAWKGTNLLMPYSAITGKPVTNKDRIKNLRAALAGVIDNAAKLEKSATGDASLNSILRPPDPNITTGNMEAERIFKLILGDYANKNKSLVTSVLDVSDLELSKAVKNIEDSIERKRLEQAVNEIKRNVMTSSPGARTTPALSSVLSARDVRDGRLSMENGEDAIRAVDSFKTAPLLVRHTALFHPHSPLSLSRQTKDMLARRTRSTTTANIILSESMPLLGDIVLCNTRDTPVERAVDRMLLSTFILKEGKNFDDICSTLPVALTSVTHNMLSAIDARTSRLLSNLKLHVNDTTSIFKNAERFEKFAGRYGDEYAMTNRQNCNCPFELHHDFRPSVDESLVRSFAYARPEITQQEIRDAPYRCNRMLSDKHYIMASTKVDARITGAALYRRVSELADMHSCVSYTGAFEPSRTALSNNSFNTAGVNLDVIVRPNNASGVLGILGCHRKHLCITDLKTSVASTLPSVFSSSEKLASELVQNALPHNRYIQKSRINAASIIFANVLDKTIKDLGVDISRDLASKLINGEFSVSETVLEETNTIMNKLMDSASLKVEGEKKDEAETGVTASAIATQYTKTALKKAVSAEMLLGSAENVPFSTAVDGSIAFDFLMSKDHQSSLPPPPSSSSSSSSDKTMVTIMFEAIANKIGDNDFKRILDEIEAKITQHEFNDRVSSMSKEAQERWRLEQQDLRRLLSFMRILKDNIAPSLSKGELGEKMKLYISLISAKSRLENTLRYGLSNSSSVDLSHLKPLNPTAVSKNIEDTFTYRNVPPVFVMALPKNFAALFQQEQRDPDYIIDNRRSLTSFLNHPNTSSMARFARASVGAGGGSALGIYPSSLLLQESTVSTMEPVVDATSNISFETPVTKSPMMIVDPYKESAGLELPNSASNIIATGSSDKLIPCSYLQVSMPTQFSGLVTNTGVPVKKTDTFELKKRDGTIERYKKLVPSVLCSDASFNLLDEFARTDTTLNDMEIKFSFMPEIVSAIAKYKGMEISDIIKTMSTKIVGGEINRNTGDISVKKSGVAFPSYAVETAKVVPTSTNTWGGTNGLLQGRLLPSFFVFNPTGAASVNGVPITREGELLAAMKREKAAGVGEGDAEEFGKGMLSEGALRAVGDKAISSELKPLKESWDKIVQLEAVFSKTARSISESINNNTIKNPESVSDIVTTLKKNYNTLNDVKNCIRDTSARIIACSDLITGGYGGDATQALIAPYKSEQMGVIGAISAGSQMGIGNLLATNSRGIEELRIAMEKQITLSSKQGREMPEHGGIRYDTGEELITDADSLFRGLTNKTAHTTPLLHRVIDTIVRGLENGDRMRRRAFADVAPTPEHHTDENKRRVIAKLLSENQNLLNAIANTMYFGTGNDIVGSNNKVLDVLGDIKYQQQMMYETVSRDGMNTLFSRKLTEV